MKTWAEAFREALNKPENKKRIKAFRDARHLARINPKEYFMEISRLCYVFIYLKQKGGYFPLYTNERDLHEMRDDMDYDNRAKDVGKVHYQSPIIEPEVLTKLLNKVNLKRGLTT